MTDLHKEKLAAWWREAFFIEKHEFLGSGPGGASEGWFEASEARKAWLEASEM